MVFNRSMAAGYAAARGFGDTAKVQDGTSGPDTLVGTLFADTLRGLGGDDSLSGFGSNDSLVGGSGDDICDGGDGDDKIDGDPDNEYGNDTCDGGAGNDSVYGGGGYDRLFGSTGADDLRGYFQDDYLDGGGDNDFLSGQFDDDTLLGGAGDDHLDGGTGDDVILGNDFGVLDGGVDTAVYQDVSSGGVRVSLALQETWQNTVNAGVDYLKGIENLWGSSYGDTLTGNGGDNYLFGWAGPDTLHGGDGADTVQGDAGSELFGDGGADLVKGNRDASMMGGDGDDTIEAGGLGSGANWQTVIDGGAGNDVVTVTNHDVLIFAATADGDDSYAATGSTSSIFSFGNVTGAVLLDLRIGGAQNTGACGTDTITGFHDIRGSSGKDSFTGSAGSETLDGGLGDDVIFAFGPTGDHYSGGDGLDVSGVDTLNCRLLTSAVQIEMNTGKLFTGGGPQISGFENVVGTSFADMIAGIDTANRLFGGAGDDSLSGWGGADTLEGGKGRDFIHGGEGADVADYSGAKSGVAVNLAVNDFQVVGGQLGADYLVDIEGLLGSKFNDSLTGSLGVNALTGGAGVDTLVGGSGTDLLSGGAGADLFRFDALSDLTPDGGFERISDLEDIDIVDLSAIDANDLKGGNQAFQLVKTFHGKAGEAALSYDKGTKTTFLQLDIDGDGVADGVLEFAGRHVAFPGFVL